MTQDEILKEYFKCKNNPYYFATKYITVKNYRGERVPFSTPLTEEEFNNMFNKLQKGEYELHRHKRISIN